MYLDDIMLMHWQEDRVDALDLITVAKIFAGANERRQMYFDSS